MEVFFVPGDTRQHQLLWSGQVWRGRPDPFVGQPGLERPVRVELLIHHQRLESFPGSESGGPQCVLGHLDALQPRPLGKVLGAPHSVPALDEAAVTGALHARFAPFVVAATAAVGVKVVGGLHGTSVCLTACILLKLFFEFLHVMSTTSDF